MKRCSRCEENLPKEMFWKDMTRRDFLYRYCKPCFRTINKAWVVKNRARYNELLRRSLKKNAWKQRARTAVADALRSGRIHKKSCAVCGDRKVQAHHYDYREPLSVIWLCTKHHSEVHRSTELTKLPK